MPGDPDRSQAQLDRRHRRPVGLVYPVAEVSKQLGVSQYSLYAWKRKFAKPSGGDDDQAAEIRRLKQELARVTEERDILKKATAYFAKDAK